MSQLPIGNPPDPPEIDASASPQPFLKLSLNDQRFLHDICATALTVSRENGFFWVWAALTVVQAILESGWGKSSLASVHRNYFGMKFANQPGAAKVTLQTTEIEHGVQVVKSQDFAAFESMKDCLAARAKLFESPRYLDVMTAPTIEEAARDVMNDGYSTDRPYLWTPADGKTREEIEGGPRLCTQPRCQHYAGQLMVIIKSMHLDNEAQVNFYSRMVV